MYDERRGDVPGVPARSGGSAGRFRAGQFRPAIPCGAAEAAMAGESNGWRPGQSLSAHELEAFRRDGFVLPRFTLAPRPLTRLIQAVAARPMPPPLDPHAGGVAAAAVLDCALDVGLLDLVEPLLGLDIVLGRSAFLHVDSAGAGAVPWRQDGTAGPIDAREILSVRLALDRVDGADGCMRLLPRPHERLVRALRNARDRGVLGLAPDAIDAAIAVDAVRAPGEVTLYDGRTLYCEPANRSGRRRAAIVFRYGPAAAWTGGVSVVARRRDPAP
jgi:Phytanoyl-CoA dioxygenase (PhyH)